MRASLTLSLPNRLSELPRLAEAVNAFLHRQEVSCEVIDTMHLVRTMVDEMVYERVGGRNIVEVKVARAPLRV